MNGGEQFLLLLSQGSYVSFKKGRVQEVLKTLFNRGRPVLFRDIKVQLKMMV